MKIAVCLVTFLAVLLATPIQAQALYGGTPPPNTISIDNGNSSSTAFYISQTDSAYIMNRMSGFAGHSVHACLGLFTSNAETPIENLILLIFSEDPALASLSSPLVEQWVTIHQFLNVG